MTKWDINISQKQLEANNTNLLTNIKEWQINVDNSYLNLKNIEKTIENTKKSSLVEIKNAQKNVELAQKNYNNSKDTLNTIEKSEKLNINNMEDRLLIEINSSIPLIDKYLRDVDVILWITDWNKYLNDSYEIYLWAKDTSTKTLTEQNRYIAKKSLDEYRESIQDVDKLNNVLDKIDLLLSSCRQMLTNTISSASFNQTTIDNLISQIENNINWNNSIKNKIAIAQQNVITAKTSYDTKIINQENIINSNSIQLEQAKVMLEKTEITSKNTQDDLEQKYKLADIAYNLAKTRLENSIAISKSQINISQANLDYKKDNIDSDELEPFYTAIDNAKKWVEEAQQKLEDTIIRSPIDGKIGKLAIKKIWSNISINPSIPFVTIIGKNSLYVEAKIEEWDISSVFVWQKVKLNFNSLVDVELSWIVKYVSDKSEITNNWIVSYKVEIDITNTNLGVKEWFTTQIYFITKEVKNKLSLPIELIKEEDWKQYVIIENWEKKYIKTWISDWDYIQIISWLNEKDRIIN